MGDVLHLMLLSKVVHVFRPYYDVRKLTLVVVCITARYLRPLHGKQIAEQRPQHVYQAVRVGVDI